MSQHIRGQGSNLVFPIAQKNTNWVKDVIIRSCFLSSVVEFHSAVSEEKSKMSQQNRRQGDHLVFLIGSKNTNMVEDVEILRPVKFRWIPFSGFIGEVGQIRGQGSHLVFLIAPENTNLVEDFEILLPIKIRWIRSSGFRGVVKYVSANQRPGQPYYFSDRSEKHKFGRRCWDLAFFQVSLNLLCGFRGKKENVSPNRGQGSHFVFLMAPQKT